MKFARKYIAFLLLLGITTNCFNQWLLFAAYSLNKSYISTVLCTNLKKPELHCEGKCFLDIKLKDLENKKQQNQDTLKRMVETFALTSTNLLNPLFATPIEKATPPYLHQKPIGNVVAIFHPPKFSLI